MASKRRCAIHQPNFFPRLRTLTKLYAADVWVILDDVQFCRRDYQHRARLAHLDNPGAQQWLSLNTHLPHGRATLINEARVVESELCLRRIDGLLAQYYARSPHWRQVREPLQAVIDLITKTNRLDEISETSTRVMLDLLGWQGEIVRSSAFTVRAGRSERLADLTNAVGATAYLCGPGGARYLDEHQFRELGLHVQYAEKPDWVADDTWQQGRNLSALWAMLAFDLRAP